MLKVVRGMRLTGGHHPRREAGASLTSPTASAPAFSGLPPRTLLPCRFVRFLADCLPVLSSSPRRDSSLATPTQAQVVPATIQIKSDHSD